MLAIPPPLQKQFEEYLRNRKIPTNLPETYYQTGDVHKIERIRMA